MDGFFFIFFIVNSSTAILHTLSYHTPNSAVSKDKKRPFISKRRKHKREDRKARKEPRQQAPTKKIFTPDEGEYVDFEEITDESKSQ